MKTIDIPDKIYLQACGGCDNDPVSNPQGCKNCIVEVEDVTWSTDRIYDDDKVYFSEKAIAAILEKVVDDANNLIRGTRQSSILTTCLDKSKYIPHIIELLKGDTK